MPKDLDLAVFVRNTFIEVAPVVQGSLSGNVFGTFSSLSSRLQILLVRCSLPGKYLEYAAYRLCLRLNPKPYTTPLNFKRGLFSIGQAIDLRTGDW